MERLLNYLAQHPDFKNVLAHFHRGAGDLLTGVNGTQKSLIIAQFFRDFKESLLIVSYSNSQAYRIATDLEQLLPPEKVAFFPANEILPHEEAYEPEVTAERIATIGRILEEQNLVIVTSWPALHRKLIPVESFAEFIIPLKVGLEYSLTDLVARLTKMGYERVDLVEELGQFSLRGDILDVFPLDLKEPVRIEFFGDQIDSLRSFQIATQLSVDNLVATKILPAREGLWSQEEFLKAQDSIRETLAEAIAKLEDLGRLEAAEKLQNRINEALERLNEGHQLAGADQFLPWIYPKLVTLFDYLPKLRVILDEPVRGKDSYRTFLEETADTYSNFLEKGVILAKEHEIFLPPGELEKKISKTKPWFFSLLNKTPKGFQIDHILTLPFKSPPLFHNKIEMLLQEISRLIKSNWLVILVVSRNDKARHLKEVLREEGLSAQILSESAKSQETAPASLLIMVADLESGFEWFGDQKVLLLTELEIYGKQKRSYQKHFQKEGSKISSFTDLKPGDYVVHINHGIGQYIKMETLEMAGSHRDYLQIEYSGSDRLYVPTDQLNMLQKYIGMEGTPPKMNKLGGAEWQKAKNKVKESIQDMAQSLLELYAKREVASGFSFGRDTVWQHEFEEAFFYEETPDQLKAIAEIKCDMEKSKPMDRLLCGDVGYGKTEVAMRAAFKAVMEGKQVGVLVPTTILAQQHFLTFRERFAGFPVNIKVLSRFQSLKEQEEVIRDLLTSKVDLVIGTHRLISADVHFKNLGFLIVDEEQRFGVSHKEKIKELRHNVDVLTLTATPIPRTLHMSLVGIRDISIIETPPYGRFPIRTHVLEYNEEVIREAIIREIDRQGQVYVVYNRVETIDRMADYLQKLVPQARIDIAHGQMDEEHLERIMLNFYDNEADILLCTTIIETGLDIPNVNTLIVYDADRFGLSQLYQLRGRVGRSNRIAHAYFCYRKDKVLSINAEKRLAAIREFTELGSGFKIAMRDLEIRGAGNLLGSEQHGQIASVGFELYCRLLDEAVKEKKGEVVAELPEPTIEIPVDAYIPSSYIADSKQKVQIYKKITATTSLEDIEIIIDEICDRFGDPPVEVKNLLSLAKVKVLAREVGFASIGKEKNELIGKVHQGLEVDYEKILTILKKYRTSFRYQPGRAPLFRWKTSMPDAELLKIVLHSLELLKQK